MWYKQQAQWEPVYSLSALGLLSMASLSLSMLTPPRTPSVSRCYALLRCLLFFLSSKMHGEDTASVVLSISIS